MPTDRAAGHRSARTASSTTIGRWSDPTPRPSRAGERYQRWVGEHVVQLQRRQDVLPVRPRRRPWTADRLVGFDQAERAASLRTTGCTARR